MSPSQNINYNIILNQLMLYYWLYVIRTHSRCNVRSDSFPTQHCLRTYPFVEHGVNTTTNVSSLLFCAKLSLKLLLLPNTVCVCDLADLFVFLTKDYDVVKPSVILIM